MRGTRQKSAVLLDRHPLWLDAMDNLVAEEGIEVVGRATDGDEAVALIEEHRPDMFIAGVDAKRGEDIDWVRSATRAHPEMRSIVMADDADPEAIEAAFAAGASVYCVKVAEQRDLASAIRQAFDRSIYIAGSSAETSYRPLVEEPVPAALELTRRELEILRLVAEGHSNAQLAGMLWVTEQTVKFHLSNIYRKLNVANRTEASRWAQLHGLLPERKNAPALAA
jgi:two-component system, NarL family, response regulator LiaR